MDERPGDKTTEKLPQSRQPIFFRPPDNWDEMTEEEQDAWSMTIAARIMGSTEEGKSPTPSP